jgi:hypothetical protein
LKIKYAVNDKMIENREKVTKWIKQQIHEWLTITMKKEEYGNYP